MTVDSLNSNKPNVIELSSVTKVYQMGSQEVKALAGVDLTVKQGEFIAVTGPSGSGKSTLMNIIGCLDVPTDGKYILNGVEVGSMKDSGLAHTRNRLIGFVFQTYNLLPKLTAQENVELPLIYGGAISRKFKAKMESVDYIEAVEGKGIINDRYFKEGNDKFKIPITSSDIILLVKSGDIRENI